MTEGREAGAAPASPSDDEDAARRKAIHNERVKLIAYYLNGLAIAVAAIGGLTPTFTNGGLIGLSAGDASIKLAGIAASLLSSVILHLSAQRLLGRLR